MCGIFAYMGHTPLSILEVLKLLHILESDQEPNEITPVGGHGAGISYLNEKGKLTLEKVGKTNGSPCYELSSKLGEKIGNSSHILGHVRRASPEFKATIKHRECTQPYKPSCTHGLNIVSTHNGKVQNYQELKNILAKPHKFESQKIELIDSEVIPHLFEELLSKSKDTTKATHALFEQIEGNNTAVILSTNKSEAHLNVIQKGKTRGLVVWTNLKREVLLCSREKPTEQILNKFLTENDYQKIIKVSREDSVNLEAHFSLNIPQST